MPINLQKAEFILSAASPKDFIRDELPQVAFAGRSNVGKSSVINRLLNRKNLARVGAAPGKTTHINYFNIDRAFYLVDLPGYGYAKVSKGERDRWGKLMESYFADRSQMTLGVMIVDSSLFFSLSSLLATTTTGQPASLNQLHMVTSSAEGLCRASTMSTPSEISPGS